MEAGAVDDEDDGQRSGRPCPWDPGIRGALPQRLSHIGRARLPAKAFTADAIGTPVEQWCTWLQALHCAVEVAAAEVATESGGVVQAQAFGGGHPRLFIFCVSSSSSASPQAPPLLDLAVDLVTTLGRQRRPSGEPLEAHATLHAGQCPGAEDRTVLDWMPRAVCVPCYIHGGGGGEPWLLPYIEDCGTVCMRTCWQLSRLPTPRPLTLRHGTCT